MAANTFEEILESIKDDSVREVLKKEAEANAALKGGWLRQSDYSRKLNELEGRAKYADAWEKWKGENWDEDLKMTKAEAQAQERIRDIQAENETLRQLQEAGDVTLEQLAQEFDRLFATKAKGVMTEQAFNDKFGKRLFDKDAYDKEINERVTNYTAARDNMYLGLYQIGFKHKDEFGEVLNPLDVIKYANENNIQDMALAHERMVSPRREERRKAEETKREEKTKTDLEAAKQAGIAQGRQEAAMGSGGRMPSDAGVPEMTHLQERLLRPAKKPEDQLIPEEVKMDGSGKLGQAVADLYRRQKLEGTGAAA